jgi:hypothetical protein
MIQSVGETVVLGASMDALREARRASAPGAPPPA